MIAFPKFRHNLLQPSDLKSTREDSRPEHRKSQDVLFFNSHSKVKKMKIKKNGNLFLCLLIAVVGVGLTVYREGEKKRKEYKAIAKKYLINYMLDPSFMNSVYRQEDETPEMKARTLKNVKKNAYYERMYKKYDWASRHPWFPVSPDEPEPSLTDD